jgi:LDH2 family malate/lactate/ureidoglycolate dehydrogenase
VGQIEPTEFKARWWATEDKLIVQLHAVRDLLIHCLTDVGMPLDKAVFTVDARLDKDMQGDHIRGVANLPFSCETMRKKNIDPNPSMQILNESTVTALLDGGNGWPYCLGYDAMRLCIQKARSHGLAMVGIRAQLGVLEPYMRMAASERLIGFGTIQGPPVIAPTGGTKPTIGNNPTGFGFPTQNGAPVVLDISFSQSSVTPIFMAAKLGQKIPQGLVLDQDGNPTDDPHEIASSNRELTEFGAFGAGGSLVPIGGYKGYALALSFGLLTSVLLGPRGPLTSPDRDWYYQRPGTLFICIDPGVFGTVEEFETTLDSYLEAVNHSPRRRKDERIFYPGQKSGEAIQEHRAAGTLPLTPDVRKALLEYAKVQGKSLDI